MTEQQQERVWSQAEGYAVARGRDFERLAWSDLHLFGGPGWSVIGASPADAQPPWTHRPSNIVSLTGSGTTGEHGWVHANVWEATILGYLVHGWEDPADVPIYRNAPFGSGYGWYLQDDDGQLTPCDPPEGYAAEHVEAALAEFERLRVEWRRAADFRRL